jgi:hypothetical protein
MRFRLLFVAAITVLMSLLLTPSANAAAQTTLTPFSFHLFFEGCTLQPGTLTGMIRTTLFLPTNGGPTVARSGLVNTTFTTDSGSTYRLTNTAGSIQVNIDPNKGFPQVLETNSNFNLVGADDQFHGHAQFIFVINGIDEVTVNIRRDTFDCNP